MSPVAVGLVGFGALVVLILLNIPIAIAMAIVGFVGLAVLLGTDGALNSLGIMSTGEIANYNLSVIPLFVLMGLFAAHAGLSRQLFSAANAVVGNFRGGLVMATVSSCAAFGAICGSSLATAATMTKVAVPEMRRHNYADSLALGSVAAGGTLGILIPPSIMLVVYALITETPLTDLFAAAIVPGVLQLLMYLVMVWILCRLRPELGPRAPAMPVSEKLRAMGGAAPVLLIFLAVIGGLYLGVFTPTEAAAVGVVLTLGYQLAVQGFRWDSISRALIETAGTTAVIFLIVMGAALFTFFMSISGMPRAFAGMIVDLGIPPLGIMFLILGLYLVLGCLMDSLGMMLLTVPVLFPLVQAISGDLGMTPAEAALWFGIFAIVAIEIGLITPPVGLNAFVIKASIADAPLSTVFKGIVPFFVTDVLRVVLLILFPAIALWFPSLLQ